MASSFDANAQPQHKIILLNSRQWPTHEYQIIEAEQRQLQARSKQRDGERRKDRSGRKSPPRQRIRLKHRQQQQSPSPVITPMSTPNNSNPCLVALPASELPYSISTERIPSGNSIFAPPLYEIETLHQPQPQYSPLPCLHSQYAPDFTNTSRAPKYTLSTPSPSLSPSNPISIPTPSSTFNPVSDRIAALTVAQHLRRHPAHSKHERILRSIISSRSPTSLDDSTLSSILTSADAIFFHSSLRGRVRFEWSSQSRYQHDLIGTTALRQAAQGGFETLVVLSEPILKHEAYDRTLLLSAFLHELVHCYLFVRCGFGAREGGGHTWGFRYIAGLIDQWVGGNTLKLGCVRANLNEFMKKPKSDEVEDAGFVDLGPVSVAAGTGKPSCTHHGEEQHRERDWAVLDDRVGISIHKWR